MKTFRITSCDSKEEAQRAAAYFREEQRLPSAKAHQHQDEWMVVVTGRGDLEAAQRRADEWEPTIAIPTEKEDEVESTPAAWNRAAWRSAYEGH